MSDVGCFVGVDVAKNHLDVAFPSEAKIWRTTNNAAGIVALGRKLASLENPHLVCEAGSYGRLLAKELNKRSISFSPVNPRRVRDFARASGRLAKTDAIDAGVILRFAQTMHPPVAEPPSASLLRLGDLVRRRRQLVEMLAMEKQRRPHVEDAALDASLKRHLDFLLSEIADIDQSISAQVEADPALSKRAALLRSIPGFGSVVAATLVAELPELGRIGKKQIAALVGVAPMNQDTGLTRGQAHIAGGRLSVRCALYMATIVAIRCNPLISPFYKRLRADGKAPKVAVVAAMRKLLIAANTIIQQDRAWIDKPA
jgi:transposase